MNENSIPTMTRSEKLLLEKIEGLERLVKEILKKEAVNSIEEISLSKAAKQLHLSANTIIDLVKRGQLEARTYKDKKRKTRYRFKLSAINNFQKETKYDHVSIHAEEYESAEDMAKRIFKV